MKKLFTIVLAITVMLSTIPAFGVNAAKDFDLNYSEHFDYNKKVGYEYDITNCGTVWVKQSTGAVVWVTADDTHTDKEVIDNAKAADGSMKSATEYFTVLRGEGTTKTPNAKGAQAIITVYTNEAGRLILNINGPYSHCVKGEYKGTIEPATEETTEAVTEETTVEPTEEVTEAPTEEPTEEVTEAPTEEPTEEVTEAPTEEPTEEVTEAPTEEPTVEPTEPATEVVTEPTTVEPATEAPTEPEETVDLRVETPKKMAVRTEDGKVHYHGNHIKVVIGKEYHFQMCAVNWKNGKYDDNGNGLCGTVVYTFKVVKQKEFNELRKEALKDPDRYTVKGMDIIDNYSKTIIINCDAENFHLETDVNNFFMAYRFHFTKGDYNKQTGIANVVDTPLESLSVNLPLGTTVKALAYKNYELVGYENVLIENNDGTGIYNDVLLTCVNDFYWAY